MKTAIVIALTFGASVALATDAATTTHKTETTTAPAAATTGAAATKATGATAAKTATTTATTTTATTAETLTVEGAVAKVVPAKKEIYVQGADAKHEFYFKPTTELLQNGKAADFATLKEGTKVRVHYVKVGKRTDPVKVEILQ